MGIAMKMEKEETKEDVCCDNSVCALLSVCLSCVCPRLLLDRKSPSPDRRPRAVDGAEGESRASRMHAQDRKNNK